MTKELLLQLIGTGLLLGLGVLAKKYLEPLRSLVRLLSGTKEKPDVMTVLESQSAQLHMIDASSRDASQNAASAVRGVTQLRDENRDAGIRWDAQFGRLEKKVANDVSELTGRVIEHGDQLKLVVNDVKVIADRVTRVETIQGKRGCDTVLHEAATEHLRKASEDKT